MLMVKILIAKRNKWQKDLFRMNYKELNIKIFKLKKLTKKRMPMMNKKEMMKKAYYKLKAMTMKKERSTEISNKIMKNSYKMLVQWKERKKLPTKKISHLSLTIWMMTWYNLLR